jgi:peptidoglycan/LPS O-acetylase OafA/YrhL
VADPMNAVRAVFPVQQTSHSPPFIPRHPAGKEASARGRHRSPSVWSPLSGRETAVVRPVDTPQGYLPGLDGLRAVAVLAVVAYHQGLAWAPGGFLGVDIFFVLSGYLITGILRADWYGRGRLDLRLFWTRRARRLLPGLAVMVVAVCAAATVLDRGQLHALRADVAAAATYTSNWWQITADHSYFARFSPPSLLQHLWSLAVEEQFYLVWPLLFALGLRYLPRRGLALAITGAAACSAVAMAVLPLVSGVGESLTDPATLDPAYRTAMLVCAALMGLGGVLAFVTIPSSYDEVRPAAPIVAERSPSPVRSHCAVGAPPLHPSPTGHG